MDRLQAKVISTMTNEQLLAVDKQCYIINMKFIKAYSEGSNILINGALMHYPSFDSGGLYEIVEPTQMINGIECPIGASSQGPSTLYYIENNYYTRFYMERMGTAIDPSLFKRGLVHTNKENAIKCCKARLNIKDYFNYLGI